MTEEERKLFAGELKEHILLPSKQEVLDNDLSSVEQILVDNKYQVIYCFLSNECHSITSCIIIYYYSLYYRFNTQRLTNMVMFIPC